MANTDPEMVRRIAAQAAGRDFPAEVHKAATGHRPPVVIVRPTLWEAHCLGGCGLLGHFPSWEGASGEALTHRCKLLSAK